MNQSYPPVLPHFSFRSSVQIYKIDFALWMIIDDNPPNLMDAWWHLKNFFSAPLSSPFFRSLLTAFASEDLDQLRFSSLKIKSKTWSHHSLRDYQCSAFISTWRSNTNIWQRHLLCDSDNQQWLHNKFLNSVDWPAFGALDAILHHWDLISLGSGKSVSFSWFILCPFVRRLSLYVFWNGFYTIKKFFFIQLQKLPFLQLEMEPNTKSAQMQMRKISSYNLPVNEVDAGPVSCCLPPSSMMSCKQKNWIANGNTNRIKMFDKK